MRVSGGVARVALAIGLTTALVSALAACGGSGDGGAGPGGRASLDPSVIGPRADRMAALTKQPVMAALLSQGNVSGVPAFQRSVAGIQRALAPALFRATLGAPALVRSTRLSARQSAPRSATTSSSSLVPDSLLGRTLVPNAQGHYAVDPTRTGAPATGVRFVIVTPGTTQEVGYADLTDQITSTSELTVLDVVGGGSVVMHDATVITTSSTGEDDTSRGYLTNGTDRVDYDFAIATTYRPVEDRTTAVLTITSPGIGISMIDSSVVSGLAAADQQVGRLTVGNTTVRTVTGAVTDPSSGYVPSDTTRVTVDGAPYATIVNGASGVSYLAPDGSALSASDRSALASVEQIAVTSIGLVLTQLIVLFWLFDATGA